MELSKGQLLIFEEYSNGKNIFLTGPGGSGKTTIIKEIYSDAIENEKKICVTALTGVAANLLDCEATTLHSWAGIGLGKLSAEKLVSKIRKNSNKKENWIKTEILVVDEISMLSLELFDKLNTIGRIIRKCEKPFGGIQVIFSGDFFQLPPVNDPFFCFESKNFNSTFNSFVLLSSIFRQDSDDFKSLLNNIRRGVITRSNISTLKSRIGVECPEGIVPTVLSPLRKLVEKINSSKMESLETDGHIYNRKVLTSITLTTDKDIRKKSKCSQEEIENALEYIKGNTLSENKLILKEGAVVMYIINNENMYNGMQGIVESFKKVKQLDKDGEKFIESEQYYPVVKFYNGTKKIITDHIWKSDDVPGIGLSQLPLILSWAVTIHKSQGSTLDYAVVNIGKDIFEAGQTYVALSRLKSLSGLFIEHFSIKSIMINPKVQEFYKSSLFESKKG